MLAPTSPRTLARDVSKRCLKTTRMFGFLPSLEGTTTLNALLAYRNFQLVVIKHLFAAAIKTRKTHATYLSKYCFFPHLLHRNDQRYMTEHDILKTWRGSAGTLQYSLETSYIEARRSSE